MPVNRANNKDITSEQILEVVKNFLDFASTDSDKGKTERENFADVIEEFFDDLMGEDYFGSEGQCHPFGDKRD